MSSTSRLSTRKRLVTAASLPLAGLTLTGCALFDGKPEPLRPTPTTTSTPTLVPTPVMGVEGLISTDEVCTDITLEGAGKNGAAENCVYASSDYSGVYLFSDTRSRGLDKISVDSPTWTLTPERATSEPEAFTGEYEPGNEWERGTNYETQISCDGLTSDEVFVAKLESRVAASTERASTTVVQTVEIPFGKLCFESGRLNAPGEGDGATIAPRTEGLEGL